jgi:predicted CoA-binding protein
MKHLSRETSAIRQLFERVRTIALIGASPRPDRRSHRVAHYLRRAGFDVVAVRADRRDLDGIQAYERLSDIPGRIDLAVIYRAPDAATAHVDEAADRGVPAVWLPPGAWSLAAQERARARGLTLVKERCPEEEHRALAELSGNRDWGHR